MPLLFYSQHIMINNKKSHAKQLIQSSIVRQKSSGRGGQEVAIFRQTAANFRQTRYMGAQYFNFAPRFPRMEDFQSKFCIYRRQFLARTKFSRGAIAIPLPVADPGIAGGGYDPPRPSATTSLLIQTC